MPHPHQNIDTGAKPSLTDSGFRHLAPVQQADSVHEISTALYRSFEKSTVNLHLSGCTIDPIPFVQTRDGQFMLLSGEQVDPEYACSLGLDQLDELSQPPVEWQSDEIRERILVQLDALRLTIPLAPAVDGRQWIIWCNHVHGILQAAAGESTVDIPFSIWGERLVRGVEQCPPFHCPLADVDTRHLDVDDEGTISDAASIVACSETGTRLVRQKMESCHVTGHLVDPAVLMTCPVTGHRLVIDRGQTCSECQQPVDPSALTRGRCASCRGLERAAFDNSVVQQLVDRYPWARRAKKWKLAPQPDSWLVQAAVDGSLWRMVIDRSTLEVGQLARSGGWMRKWTRVPESDRPEFLTNGLDSS